MELLYCAETTRNTVQALQVRAYVGGMIVHTNGSMSACSGSGFRYFETEDRAWCWLREQAAETTAELDQKLSEALLELDRLDAIIKDRKLRQCLG